jgi:hypothetical protein
MARQTTNICKMLVVWHSWQNYVLPTMLLRIAMEGNLQQISYWSRLRSKKQLFLY